MKIGRGEEKEGRERRKVNGGKRERVNGGKGKK